MSHDFAPTQVSNLRHRLARTNIAQRTIKATSYAIMVCVVVVRLSFALTVGLTGSDEITFVIMLMSAAAALLALRLGFTQTAAWVLLLNTAIGMFYGGLTSVVGQSMTITGYIVGLTLAIMILPGRRWLILFALQVLAIGAATYYRYQAPLPNWTSSEQVTFGIIQLGGLLVATTTLWQLYRGATRLLRELEDNNIELETVYEALSAKTDLLEIITGNLPVRIAYFDTEENLQFCNRAFVDAYVPHIKSKETLHGSMQRFVDHVDPARREKRRPYYEAAQRGETVTFELVDDFPSGDVRVIQNILVPHIEGGEVVGRVSLGVDITELRETQDTLRKNLELFQLVINNVPARIAYIDRSNTVIFVNEQVMQAFGVKADALVGQNVLEVLPPEYIDSVEHYVRQAYKTKQPLIFETPVTMYEGDEIIERSYYYPHIVNDRVEALFMLHMDVTEIKRTEQSLNKAQKLESLGLLAGGIAHDFNNLLVAMLGQNSLALAKISDSHPARRHIAQSVAAAERAAALTQQMLAYSGRGAFSIGALDLNELIENNLKLFEVSIPKNVQLVTDLSAELPLIEADTAQMQQLIMNLIINAGQAIGQKNGRITVLTDVQTITGERGEFWEITGDKLVPGRYVSVQVQDDGIGMDAETRQKIFDPFYTTKESGTGLGLAAALGIIRGHKGGIRLYSEVGHGTVFHLLFPAAKEQLEPVHIEKPPTIEVTDSYTVLVIDDEVNVVNTVADMLEMRGITTIQATRGKDGLKIYTQNQQEIGLVLLDLMMPGMNGDEVFQRLREINPNVRVILSSGYSEAEATRRFVGQNLADFIQKPYDFETLVTRVLTALELQTDECAEKHSKQLAY